MRPLNAVVIAFIAALTLADSAAAPAALAGTACPSTVDAAAFPSVADIRALVTKEMSVGQRVLASPSHRKTIRWIEDEVRGIHDGFEVESDEYQLYTWQPRTRAKDAPGLDIGRAGGLRVRQDGLRAEDVPVAGAVHWSKPTSQKGVGGPLVYLGPDEEITADNAAGKVVIRDFPGGGLPYAGFPLLGLYVTPDLASETGNYERPFIHDMHPELIAAGQAGAAGVVYAFDVPREQVLGYYDPHVGTIYRVPAVFVGYDEAARLKTLAAEGASARLVVRAKAKRVKTRNLIATLPGESAERIVLAANTDGNSWVQENGVAGILALARYYASLPAPCRRRTLVLLFASAHDTLVADGTNRFAERLDPEYDQGTVAFAFALEHFGAREILPMPDGDGSGRRLEFTGKGDPFLFAAGDGAALRQAAVEATQRRNLDRTAVMPGLALPVAGQVPPICSMGGLGNAFHRRLIPTVAMISGPWSLYDPAFGSDALDFDRMHAQLLAAGDALLALDALPREEIAGDYPAMRQLRAEGAPTCPAETYPQFAPGPGE
jgi:hypothetical protein